MVGETVIVSFPECSLTGEVTERESNRKHSNSDSKYFLKIANLKRMKLCNIQMQYENLRYIFPSLLKVFCLFVFFLDLSLVYF